MFFDNILFYQKTPQAYFAAAEIAETPNGKEVIQTVLDGVVNSGISNTETNKVHTPPF